MACKNKGKCKKKDCKNKKCDKGSGNKESPNGKGDAPRTYTSPLFRLHWDQINWSGDKKDLTL
jgi:hypothetical protein